LQTATSQPVARGEERQGQQSAQNLHDYTHLGPLQCLVKG
jgi:hypothetical protein